MTKGFFIAVASLILYAGPSAASPIEAPVEDCVKLADLNVDPLTWSSRAGEMRWGAYHDPIAGCGETVFYGIGTRLVWREETGFESASIFLEELEPCGRFQFDFDLGEGTGTLTSVVIDTGIDCDPPVTPGEPRLPSPPPTPNAIPEPGTGLLLLGSFAAYGWRAARRRLPRS